MVCSKCAKLVTGTSLATPGVKKKNDMYYGSSASSSAGSGAKKSATLGQNGIGKASLRCPCNILSSQALVLTSTEQTDVKERQESVRAIREVSLAQPYACHVCTASTYEPPI